MHTNPPMQSSHVALLRGINVGGRRRVSMEKLVELFENAGGWGVRTYIQSGNVVFQAPSAGAAGVAVRVSETMRESLGIHVPVTLRTRAELARVVANNPFLKRGKEKELHVAFLADKPNGCSVAAMDANRSPGDAFAVVGREVYMHLPNGAGRSKLTTDWLDRALGTVSTVRNWRTTLKLLQMLSSPA